MPTDADALARLSALLDEALDLDPAQFEAWASALPADAQALVPQLREMLARREGTAASFLEAGPQLDAERDDSQPAAGDRIGPYVLLRELGRGGMGTVWLAERSDGVMKRRVALKLPRLAWGASLARRMARERQIGAQLEHPRIARLYDAGVDDLGRPYLAFEFIDGVAIDAWCDAQALDIAARLRLFVQVARAVAHAHGRLVVHRDLKPSNVLVTSDGQAHLLDFGIAKLIDDAASDDTALTREHGRMMTLRYASPEQIEGRPVAIGTDIWSLGVLLFELLTGRHPHEPVRPTSGALERAILDDEPALASGRVAPGDARRARALRGELDAILAKALRRDPQERYPNADAFADDVERYLAGETVVARPQGWAYRARKFAWRHRVGLGTGGIVLAVALAAGTVTLVQAQRAARAAERERVVRAFVTEVFRANGRGAPAGDAARAAAPEDFIEGSARLIETRFANQPELQAELYGVVGGVFRDMGAYHLAADYSARRVDTLSRLGADREERAEAMLASAQSLFDDERYDEAANNTQLALKSAAHDSALAIEASLLLVRTRIEQGRLDDAQALLADIERRVPATGVSVDRSWMLACRARLLHARNRLDEARPLWRQAVDLALRAQGPLSPAATSMRLDYAYRLSTTAFWDEARQVHELAVATLRQQGGAHAIRAELATATFRVAAYGGGGHGARDDVLDTLRKSREALRSSAIALPSWYLAQLDFWIGDVEIVDGDFADGMPLILASAPALLRMVESPERRRVIVVSRGSGLSDIGQYALADTDLRDAMALRKAAGVGIHPYAVNDYILLARNLMRSGKYGEAEDVLSSAPHVEAMHGEGWGTQDRYNAFLLREWVEILLAEGRGLETLPLLDRIRPPADAGQFDVQSFKLLEGEALLRVGRIREAMPLLDAALAMALTDEDFPQAPERARLQALTGLCALALGDRQAALHHAVQAQTAFERQPEVSDWFKAPYRELAEALKKHPPRTTYFEEIRSTSNTSVAFGGITPPAPRAP